MSLANLTDAQLAKMNRVESDDLLVRRHVARSKTGAGKVAPNVAEAQRNLIARILDRSRNDWDGAVAQLTVRDLCILNSQVGDAFLLRALRSQIFELFPRAQSRPCGDFRDRWATNQLSNK